MRTSFQTGKRGTIHGFPPIFYEGGEYWDESIPVKGKAAEKGCVGCPWYDIQRWKKMIFEQLSKMKNNFNTTGGKTLKTNRHCYFPGNDELSICHEHENNMQYPLESIETSLTEVFASMKNTGVRISLDELHRFDEYLKKIIEQTKQAIYDEAGHEFNISSPKQLGTVLFEELGLPTRWRYSERLIETFPIVDNVRKYRMYMKIYTYVTGLYNNIASDDRLHICYNQTDIRTGRISTYKPNIQNIPVHTELGSHLRKFFIAEKGKVLIDADYKQIELRVMAHLCGDKNMIEAFTLGEDVHSSTAALLFDIPIYKVTPEMREIAKAVNFSIIYGIGAFSFSTDIGTSITQARKYIQKYHEKYPKVNKFMEKIASDAEKTGEVVTLFSRKRHIPELFSSNKVKRIAINYLIQGTVADIIKIAMIKVYHRLKAEKLPAQLVLQVHNELIIESDISCAERCQKILCEEMQNVYDMKVPLIVDIHQGANWYETRKK